MFDFQQNIIHLGIVDDHKLFRRGLVKLIEHIDGPYQVMLEAGNGKELLQLLRSGTVPDVILLDLRMPIMDGLATTTIIKEEFKGIAILVLTMMEDEASLIKLIRAGVNGYLNKDVGPKDLETALSSIVEKGHFYSEKVTGKLVHAIQNPFFDVEQSLGLNERELLFIKLACSEDTYDMIADKMCLSAKTIDGYRGRVFEKLNVKSRVGLVLFAIKAGLVPIP